MLVVETIAKIRRLSLVQGKSIKEICRELRISRKVVRKVLRSDATEFRYERERQPMPKIGPWQDQLDGLLDGNHGKAGRERLTLIRIYEELRGLGYEGSYDAVRRYAKGWAKEQGSATAEAYVPLFFAPGEAYQFDWSHEIVLINGVTVTVKVAHVRLCHSRMMFVRAYPRETQEMVFDAHDRAFAFFGGACTRGIYDNMKTAVETVFVGKDRQYNRRFLQMCSHYLVQPVACTPASGWEKGQVENQVGLVRERFFTPRLRFKSYEELNAWLLDKCIAYTKAHRHIEQPERTIWNVFEDERGKLVEYRGPFDGFHTVPASVSKTCTVRFDNNKYSVLSTAVGRPVEIQAYADRIVIRQDGVVVAEHVRSFGRGDTIYNPWHYVPVLARKPGALRNGAPFQDWVLPSAMERVRRRLKSADDGDRQMVAILAAVLSDGLDAVEAACQEALDQNVCSSAVIINILARQRDPAPAITILTPDALRLAHEPVADCARYDRLRRAS
ncbi:IS21 family transposase [Mesorhizobium sp. INR15]|nr:IS21 family transposase [Mesorhizobium sp. INR15]QPC94797.1 IS21 family transposase [Mesorhizobium sp. INR15]